MDEKHVRGRNALKLLMNRSSWDLWPSGVDGRDGKGPSLPHSEYALHWVPPSVQTSGFSSSFFARLQSNSSGFTLLELVLATLISSLVIGILSVCLSFSLRTWERQQNQKRLDTPAILGLLKLQLVEFYPLPITLDGQARALIAGERNSLALATDHSVKAISGGVPVIARYVFVPGEKNLYYAEMPLDPYHPERIQEFMRARPGKDRSYPRFLPVQMDEFSLSYAAEEKESYTDSWEADQAPPRAVMIKWKLKDDPTSFSYAVYPNFLFRVKSEGAQPNAGALRFTPKSKAQAGSN